MDHRHGQALREKAKVKTSTQARDQAEQVQSLGAKLSPRQRNDPPLRRRPVTAPKTTRISVQGRLVDASIRAAGIAPLRLDLAPDAAFCGLRFPLGVSLTRRSDS